MLPFHPVASSTTQVRLGQSMLDNKLLELLEIRFGLVWFGLVWFGLVWFGLVWLG